VARFSSEGGTPQKEVPRSTRVEVWIGATSNSARLSSRLQLTMAFFRSKIEEKVIDFLEAPLLLSWLIIQLDVVLRGFFS
jgi:hypothetical protein